MMKARILGLLVVVVAFGCVDSYEMKTTASTNMLVVEGVISNQLKRHQILLSRTTSLTDRELRREQNATVWISDENDQVLPFIEAQPGVYETPELSAAAGKTYVLHIKTSDGGEYRSREVEFNDGVDMGNVYAKYIDNPDGDGKGIQVYVDTEDPSNQTRFYRWDYIETYEVHAPFPSNWVWLGGNEVEFRIEGLDTCYVTDTLRSVHIRNTLDLEQDKITGERIRFIPDYAHLLRYRYSILVQQYCLSEESYLFWENLRLMSEEQGSLSDVQPGSVPGNMVSLTNPNETVLGYFDACSVSEQRIFFSAIDFYNEGLKMPDNFRSYCYEIGPVLIPQTQLDEAMQKYERTMYIWEVFGMSPDATFQLMPKSCCDCRDQGPVERPAFF